jgi:hypothetical protein
MNQRTALHSKAHKLCVTDLRVGRVYMTPLGRMCLLIPKPEVGPGSGGDRFTFRYLDDGDTFTLTGTNVSMLREGVR